MKKIIAWLRNVGRIELLLKQQLYQEKLLSLPQTAPRNLLLSGYGAYSQNDEDGIIQEIFKRIGLKNQIAVEIAVGSGLESNSHLLLQSGWKCFWFETSEMLVRAIKQEFSHWIETKQLVLTNEWITGDNCERLFRKLKIPIGIDLLSLDIDGQELSLWKAIRDWQPRVVIIEYNAALGPDLELTASAEANSSWDHSSINFGASLPAICRAANSLGYVLVSCNYTGVNAFFVQKKYASKFTSANQLEKLYQPPRLGGYIKPGFKRTAFVWKS